MKKNLIILILIILAVGAFFYFQKEQPWPTNENFPTTTADSIVGCYVATLGKDVYSLKVSSQNGEAFEGTLVFKNFEKDSSSGTYKGTFKDGILLGDYSFQSEGMYSVMQVIFKKVSEGFLRGYGSVNEEGNRFTDLNSIDFSSSYSYIFKASNEECAIPKK